MTDSAYYLGGVQYLSSSLDGVPATFGGDKRANAPNVQVVRVYYNPQGQNSYAPSTAIQFMITGGPNQGFYRSGHGFIEGVLSFTMASDVTVPQLVPEANYEIQIGRTVKVDAAATTIGYVDSSVMGTAEYKNGSGTIASTYKMIPRRAAYLFWRLPGWQSSCLRNQQQLELSSQTCYNQLRPDLVLALRMGGASISSDYRSITHFLGPGIFSGSAITSQVMTVPPNLLSNVSGARSFSLSSRLLSEFDLVNFSPGVIAVAIAVGRGFATTVTAGVTTYMATVPTVEQKLSPAGAFTGSTVNSPYFVIPYSSSGSPITYQVPFVWFTECPILDSKQHFLPLFMLGHSSLRIWLTGQPNPLAVITRPRPPVGVCDARGSGLAAAAATNACSNSWLATLDDLPPGIVALTNTTWAISDLRFNYESVRVGRDFEVQYMNQLRSTEATHNIPFILYLYQSQGLPPGFLYNADGTSTMAGGTANYLMNVTVGSVSGVCMAIEQKPGNPYPHFFSLRGLQNANVQLDGVNVLQNQIIPGQYDRLYIEARRFWDSILDRSREPAFTKQEWLMYASCFALNLEKVNEEDMANRGVPVARTVRWDVTFAPSSAGGGTLQSSKAGLVYHRYQGYAGQAETNTSEEYANGDRKNSIIVKNTIQGPLCPPTANSVGGITEDVLTALGSTQEGETWSSSPIASCSYPQMGGVDQEVHLFVKVNVVLSINAEGQFVVGS